MSDRIVVLDGHTLNPGDLDWQPIAELGDLVVHDRSGAARAERMRGALYVLTNKELITEEMLADSPETRYVGVLATGVNVVDLEACRRHDVTVTNIPGYGSESVAQHVFALLLEFSNHVAAHDSAVREGQWTNCPDFCFTVSPLRELAGKTLGIVGLGDIGRRVAQIGHAFGMNIVAAEQRRMDEIEVPGVPVRWLPLDDFLAECDIVTLHCPLTPETEHLIDGKRLARMKPEAILINTGRGPLLDEAAVAEALESNRLGAVAIDVLSSEPPSADNPLLSAPRCLITPHIAWATREARQRLMQIAAENLRAFQQGQPRNVVNS